MKVTEIDVENLIKAAFYLGFYVSREGFNAECPYNHLAPYHILNHGGYEVETKHNGNDRFEDFSFGEEFDKLSNQAVEILIKRGKDEV